MLPDLTPGAALCQDPTRVAMREGFTRTTRALLARLVRAPASKKELIRETWRYRYHLLQHDPVVYAAVNALRKALGPPPPGSRPPKPGTGSPPAWRRDSRPFPSAEASPRSR